MEEGKFTVFKKLSRLLTVDLGMEWGLQRPKSAGIMSHAVKSPAAGFQVT